MKKIINIIIASIISLSLSVFAVNAGELTVTGSAQATYTITSSDSSTGKQDRTPGLGMSNELAFGATGEFGNGYTWKYEVELDPASGGSGAALNDDTRLELGTPFGTIGIYNSEGDLNTHLSSSVAAYAPGHDIGSTGGYQGGTGMNSYNNIQWHSPADLLPFGTSVKIAWSNGDNAQSADANDQGSGSKKNINSYQVTTKPIDGLTVGASYLEKQDTATAVLQKYETGGAYAKYSVSNFSFGIGRHYVAPNVAGVLAAGSTTATAAYASGTANSAVYSAASNAGAATTTAKFFQNDSYSVAFNVNEQLTLSYDKLSSTAEKRALVAATRADTDISTDLEIDTIQAAYNIGGAVVAVSLKDISNANYAQGQDIKETTVSLKMAF
jgi:hypothetical protein